METLVHIFLKRNTCYRLKEKVSLDYWCGYKYDKNSLPGNRPNFYQEWAWLYFLKGKNYNGLESDKI